MPILSALLAARFAPAGPRRTGPGRPGPLTRGSLRPASVVLVLALAGCSGGAEPDAAPPPDLIEREVFVETFVDLRIAALDNPAWVITPAERDSVLAAHGVTAEQIEQFVLHHGRDVRWMRELWDEVDARILERLAPDTDSAGGG